MPVRIHRSTKGSISAAAALSSRGGGYVGTSSPAKKVNLRAGGAVGGKVVGNKKVMKHK